MPAEAWVALGLGIASILGGVLWAVFTVTSKLTGAVTRFEIVGTQQATEIKELKEAVQKFGDVISLVAVQKEEIRSLREIEMQNTKRTDETFTRIFARLDNVQK
jgi:hypothetical protein